MKLANVFTVFRKEFLDVIRDRRTLISMILLPLGIIPLMIFGLGSFAGKQYQKLEEKSYPVILISESEETWLVNELEDQRGLQVITTVGDTAVSLEMLQDRTVQAILYIPAVDPAVSGTDPVAENGYDVQIWYDRSRDESSIVERKVRKGLVEYRDMLVRDELQTLGLPYSVVRPFDIQSHNRASDTQMAGAVLGMLLPYMVILMSLTGITYPAIDMTAGEKERHTMETLLISPATRTELVLGKFLTASLVGVISSLLSVVSLAVTFSMLGTTLGAEVSGELQFRIDPVAFGIVVILLVPVATLFAALIIAIAVNARSYKEAQSYVYPIVMLVIFPAMASMMPGVQEDVRMAFVPVVNVSLALRNTMVGTIDFNLVLITFLTSVFYAAIAIFIAVRIFQKESVLLRT
ncbi:hypothetical protein CEE37_07920 [candidate division LCP-89 bacterium B3_LCP]|uniref:Sodium ABC transporter permease n=1 Tax=candidate division LCP-89 bacterium B3_LCP TaxID=2012998 RepID=A0A532UZ55_UNCL8|nr:MAG: hypothetical protein CEE37_07920 [candidate division LCP-89 bacterium B3_LCP]